MIETEAAQPRGSNLFRRGCRGNPEDGVGIIGTRGVQACQEETGPRRKLIRGEPSTLSHLCEMWAKFRPLPLADLYEQGNELLPLRTDGRGVGKRITIG
jgi:hypothetical protein